MPLAGAVYEFRGSVAGDHMRGEAASGARTLRWSAERINTATIAGR
jgi:hypothetical protein